MPDTPSSPDSGSPTRLRATNTFLAIVILILLGQIAYQEMRISGLKADVDQARRNLETQAEKLAIDKMQGHREEMVGVVAFVDDLYRSADGLQRPGGLYNPQAQAVDAEAIGTWVLDVYLKARIAGRSDAEARQAIADAIKGSEEWRRKHEKK
jgi:hypothetical protein